MKKIKTLEEDGITHKWEDSIKVKNKIYQLVLAFVIKHNDGESIFQSDSAQSEALELACEFSTVLNYTRKYEEDGDNE